MNILDFTEIPDGESFQDLIEELIRRKPGVLEVRSTGRGPDYEADLIATVENNIALTGTRKTLTAVIQCKHFAKSKRSVRKEDVRPIEAMIYHKADLYILATSTCVGSFYAGIIQAMKEDNKLRGLDGSVWDSNRLESELLEENNHDLLRKYFPRSSLTAIKKKNKVFYSLNRKFKTVRQEHNNSMPSIKNLKDIGKTRSVRMEKIYLITSTYEREVLKENAIRKQASKLGIGIETSSDVSNDLLWSIEKSRNHDKHIRKADAVFAVVTKSSSKSPSVWFEIEKARVAGNLKIVFIDESVYSITTLGHYPCVLIKKNMDTSISDLTGFYRGVFQRWGPKANKWFWFALTLILAYHDVPRQRMS